MTKKIALLNTSLEGGVAKSTTSMGQIEAARQAGKSVSITLLDKDHKELVRVYGSDVEEHDIREDRESIVNILASDADVSVVDFPAASMEEMNKVFPDINDFLDSFAQFDRDPIFVVPLATEKSLTTIKALEKMLSPAQGGYQVHFNVMGYNFKDKQATIAYADQVKDMVSGWAQEHPVKVYTTHTRLNPSLKEKMKNTRVSELLAGALAPMDKILATAWLKEHSENFGHYWN